MARRKGINWDTQPLGQVPDSALANMLGVSHYNVARQRHKRGIPPTKERSCREKIRSVGSWFVLEPANGEQCARCGYARDGIRMDWDDVGYVCLDCWLHSPKCSVDGCDGLALATGLCRGHEVGDTWTNEDYRALAEHLGHYASNGRVYPEPGQGYAKKDLLAAIPLKPKDKKDAE